MTFIIFILIIIHIPRSEEKKITITDFCMIIIAIILIIASSKIMISNLFKYHTFLSMVLTVGKDLYSRLGTATLFRH